MGGRLTIAPPAQWCVRAATVTGASHRARDEAGQDAVAHRLLDDGRVAIAVADGAGSAPLSAEGSQAAVAAALDALAAGVGLGEAFEAAAAALAHGDDDPAVRATTLLVAVAGPDVIDIGQVGDGHVVIRRTNGVDGADGVDRAYEIAGAVDDEREYLNETTFLSSPRWRDELFTAEVPATDVDAIALMTDGLQLVAIELATSTPHPGFFDPLVGWASSADANDDDLAEFLSSPRLAERTDDDLTIAIAVRPS